MTLDELNLLDRAAFIGAVGWVFEHSPWVAERAWEARPFASVPMLHATMTEQVECAGESEQLALLRAHPDLGTRARLTAASSGEQTGAGLDSLTQEEFAELNLLNSGYRGKFGFPFLLAVKGSTKHDVLRALRVRMNSSREDEFREALRQVFRIARFRLEDLVSEPDFVNKGADS